MKFPRRGNSLKFNFPHMWIYTYNCEFPLVEKAPENAYIRCADLHKFWCITACEDTQFNVNSHMRKSVFPQMRICTVLSELPHVEIHISMCKSAPAEIRFSPCGNSHEIVHFRMWKYTKNCGFPNVRKYSLFGVFPHVEIQAGK